MNGETMQDKHNSTERRIGVVGQWARRRKRIGALAVASSLLALAACGSGGNNDDNDSRESDGTGGTLVIAMTAANVPGLDTSLVSSEGAEGNRMVGYQIYDGLTKLVDLDNPDDVVKPGPGLAVSFESNADATVWTYKLRSGVKFQDGTPFNADAVIFNLKRFTDPTFKYYDAAVAARASTQLGLVKSFKKIDDMTIEFDMTGPDSHFSYDTTSVFIGSPTAIQKEGNDGFKKAPVGTGPFKFESQSGNEQLTLVKNPDYWGGAPKLDKLILKPIPDATARVAALKTGEVNWDEYVTPDSIESLKSQGFQITSNAYDWDWPWLFDVSKPPFDNKLVRQAANYAINREAMATSLLHDTATPAYQMIAPASAAYDKANDMYSYDPDKAKELLKEAGYPNGVKVTLSYPTSGSGNMIPGPMNEELQQDLAAVGIDVKLEPVEWSIMVSDFNNGKITGGANAQNISLGMSNELFWPQVLGTGGSRNTGHYSNPKLDALLAEAAKTGDYDKRYEIYKEAGKIVTEDAPWLFVVNDTGPRAQSPKVHGFVQPKTNAFDLTHVWVAP